MSHAIDWTELAERLGTITWTEGGGRSERGGTVVARKAVIELLGDEAVLSAVEHGLEYRPGFELARSVLRELRPQVAMDRCMEIYRSAPEIETARAAAELLRSFADGHALEWYPELLQDEDEIVRCWAVGLIDRLYMTGDIEPEEGVALLQGALQDEHDSVRQEAGSVIAMFEHDIALAAQRGTRH